MILPWYLKGFVGANLLSLLTGVPNSCKPELWQKRMQGIKPYVAKIGSEIVAYADVQNDGYIDHFFVHANHQGKGVGAVLMQAIIRILTMQGGECDRLYLHVSITATPFFKRHGFEVVKEQEVEIKGVKLRNNIMERELNDTEESLWTQFSKEVRGSVWWRDQNKPCVSAVSAVLVC